jgi:hypothetical protein
MRPVTTLAGLRNRVSPADYDQLHHFVAVGAWDEALLEPELLARADRLVGEPDAILMIDDAALPKKGTHSVGVGPQYTGSSAFAGSRRGKEKPADHCHSPACRPSGAGCWIIWHTPCTCDVHSAELASLLVHERSAQAVLEGPHYRER